MMALELQQGSPLPVEHWWCQVGNPLCVSFSGSSPFLNRNALLLMYLLWRLAWLLRPLIDD